MSNNQQSQDNKKTCAEWLRRAGRTFFQAVVGYAGVNIAAAVAGVSDTATLKNALLSLASAAIAAGIAALMNMNRGTDKQ